MTQITNKKKRLASLQSCRYKKIIKEYYVWTNLSYNIIAQKPGKIPQKIQLVEIHTKRKCYIKKWIINNFPNQKIINGLTAEKYQTFKEEIKLIFHNS